MRNGKPFKEENRIQFGSLQETGYSYRLSCSMFLFSWKPSSIMKSWILFMICFRTTHFFFFLSFSLSLPSCCFLRLPQSLFFLIHLFCLSPLFSFFFLTLCFFFFVMTPSFRTIVPQQRTTLLFYRHSFLFALLPLEKKRLTETPFLYFHHLG